MWNSGQVFFRTLLITIAGAVIITSELGRAEGVAGVFLEPAITYEVSNSSVSYPSPLSSSAGMVNGLGLGLRAGLHLSDLFFAGLDGRYATPQFTDSSTNYSASATEMNWGPVVGIQWPLIGGRFWLGYVVSGSLNPAASSGLDMNFSQGSGYRIGAGIRVILLSVNLEYQDLSYGSATLEQVGGIFNASTNFSSVNLRNKSWILSVSLPLAF